MNRGKVRMAPLDHEGRSGYREISGVGLKGQRDEWAEGPLLVVDGPISFLGDVDPDSGILDSDGRHCIGGTVLAFGEGAGSTVGSYVIYNLKLNGKGPVAMVMRKADAIITIGCIVADIPLVHRITDAEFEVIGSHSRALVNSARGIVRLI